MAHIIHIRKDEKPPEDQDWVLLERTPSGRYAGIGCVAHAQGVTFDPFLTEDWEATISRAVDWADSRGIPAIYVRDRKGSA
jgi:hypothetical protein